MEKGVWKRECGEGSVERECGEGCVENTLKNLGRHVLTHQRIDAHHLCTPNVIGLS